MGRQGSLNRMKQYEVAGRSDLLAMEKEFFKKMVEEGDANGKWAPLEPVKKEKTKKEE